MESIGELYNRLEPGVPTAVPEWGLTITRWEHPPSDAPGIIVSLDERDLAVAMHDHLCMWDHHARCGWEFEIFANEHRWTATYHTSWMRRARELRAKVPDVSIKDIIAVLKGL